MSKKRLMDQWRQNIDWNSVLEDDDGANSEVVLLTGSASAASSRDSASAASSNASAASSNASAASSKASDLQEDLQQELDAVKILTRMKKEGLDLEVFDDEDVQVIETSITEMKRKCETSFSQLQVLVKAIEKRRALLQRYEQLLPFHNMPALQHHFLERQQKMDLLLDTLGV